VNLGIALFYDQNLDGAMAVLGEAEKDEPLNPYAQFVLGLVHRNRGAVENAIVRFSKVAGIDERCAAAHYNLGLLYSHQRREAEAEAEFRRALALDPDYAAAMYNLGGLLVKSGRADEGTRILERFRVLSQKDRPSSGMGSGPQYGKLGRYAMAIDYQPPPASPHDPVVP
jgi:tetratricopeptide (TPR) repeat protein